ncbi:hypothetical protein ACIBO4_19245 [Streptomyces sp. NPDC050149]|uniref:hypothetical protein n=1 Tax=Streptomyces sp. NPDC050149 TaxID=3365603 RepID=UPI0037A51FCA
MPPITSFSVDAAFNGPPTSANGGYACGVLAELARSAGHLTGPLAVSLHLPVPLDTPLVYRPAGRRGHAWHGEDVVATVTAANGAVPAPTAVSATAAAAAQESFSGAGHPFPTCFVCGTEREKDGLSLRPGAVEGRPDTVACRWRPRPELADASGLVRPEVVWAALDCPGGWTTDPVRRPRLLGRMTAGIDDRPRAGAEYVVVGRLDSIQDRTATNVTALYEAETGRLLARASALWIAIDADPAA